MYTQGFGELLTDILTANPSFAGIASASAILDASNYTFHAVTFGKDAEGYTRHAHTVINQQLDTEGDNVSGFNNNLVVVRNFTDNSTFASSYDISSTYLEFSASYNSVPLYPAPNHQRLELASTEPTTASAFPSAIPDVGHYLNVATASSLSSSWNVVGGFPPSGYQNFDYFILSGDLSSSVSDIRTDGSLKLATSGQLSGVFNSDAIMDKDGFLHVNEISGIGEALSAAGTATRGSAFSGGALIFSTTLDQPSGAITNLAVRLKDGDAASIAMFGGFQHLGVWCLDIKETLKQGLTPPFSWDNLDNLRKYKLVSKVSFWDNLMTHNDHSSNSGMSVLADSGSAFDFGGPVFIIKFNFK